MITDKRSTLPVRALLAAPVLAGLMLASASRSVPVAALPDGAPFTVLYSGVAAYTLTPTAVYWRQSPACNPSPLPVESVSVLSLIGSLPRPLYAQSQPCGTNAILSNILVDQQYLYWIALNGLVRLPRTASPTVAPQLVNALIAGPGEIVDAGDRIYALSRTGNNTDIAYVRKDNGARVPVTTLSGAAFALSYDGDYLYYLIGSTLIRLAPGGAARELGSGITGYYADGRRRQCQGTICVDTQLVYLGQGSDVSRFDNLNDSLTPIYASPDDTAVILGITTDGEKLFFYERRTTACDPLCAYSHNLIRASRNGVAAPEDGPIYSSGDLIDQLAVQDGLLYWRESAAPPNGMLKRLATSSEPLSLNLNVNNILVTQGIQHLSNNVPLVENRRTFVRVFAQSNGPDAPGVAAFLYGSWNGVSQAGPLVPVNPAGTKLTVRNAYLQEDINQAFLFELPWEWTTKSDLRLRVQLNPYQLPLETNYADNSFAVGPLDFQPSGRLAVQFVSFGFTLNNQTYYPSLVNDVLANYSWIRRVYPLASTPGFMNDPTPGFRPNNWLVFDAGLAARVSRMSPECQVPPYIIRDQNGNITKDDRQYCASGYTNAQMATLRQENNLSKDIFMYGMVRDLGGPLFPRGQAGGGGVSSGPAGPGWVGYYAGHEIGHTLGRGHPLTGNGQCDLSGGDPSPNYPNARIGPVTGVVEGFDAGDPVYGLPKAVLPGPDWVDMMAYCHPQWISDQNYKKLFEAIPAAALGVTRPRAAGGPALLIAGVIDPASDTAAFTAVRAGSFPVDPGRPGPYTLRLLDAKGSVLRQQPLDAGELAEGPGWLGFNLVVELPPGVRRIELARAGKVLASRDVSASAPALGPIDVTVSAGTVTLAWSAGDADGDALRYDIIYSRDGGLTFQPIRLGQSEAGVTIDAATLGGGSEIVFRVIASDGALAARRDSAPVALPVRPPQVRILSPGENTALLFGQTINLIGEALDPQDGGLSGASLIWTVDGAPVGEGALITLPDLPPGAHEIGLRATNSDGLSANSKVEITVADDLKPPGPFLSTAPASVTWHIQAGDGVQHAAVVVANAGGGTVTWTAESSAAWLRVTPVNGGTTLALEADPAGLPINQLHATTITITATGGQGSAVPPVTVPVQLAIGNLRAGPVPGSRQILLPFVGRP